MIFKNILFLERREGREKERERNIDMRQKPQWDSSRTCLTGDQTHNPGIFPDWESNGQPLTLQDDSQPNEPH